MTGDGKMRQCYFLLLLLLLTSYSLKAQERGIGVGFSLGMPTGISLKAWLSRTEAIQVGVGWNQHHNSYVTAEYLKHNLTAIRSKERFPVYYGAGVVLGRTNVLGARGIVGIVWCSRSAPIDIFLQAAPVLYLTPSTFFDVDACLGFRYFF